MTTHDLGVNKAVIFRIRDIRNEVVIVADKIQRDGDVTTVYSGSQQVGEFKDDSVEGWYLR